VFLIEASYENELVSAAVLRQQAYGAVLSGGMGQVFGNSPIWCFSTVGGCIYGGPGDWHTQLGSQGAQDQTRLKTFFAQRHWEKLVPDAAHTFVTAGFSGASAERASDGSWGAVYVPSARTVTVNLATLAKTVQARWFNPATGSYSDVPGTPFANSGNLVTRPPASGDWLLVLE
jgi:hypothetical protein